MLCNMLFICIGKSCPTSSFTTDAAWQEHQNSFFGRELKYCNHTYHITCILFWKEWGELTIIVLVPIERKISHLLFFSTLLKTFKKFGFKVCRIFVLKIPLWLMQAGQGRLKLVFLLTKFFALLINVHLTSPSAVKKTYN